MTYRPQTLIATAVGAQVLGWVFALVSNPLMCPKYEEVPPSVKVLIPSLIFIAVAFITMLISFIMAIKNRRIALSIVLGGGVLASLYASFLSFLVAMGGPICGSL